MAEIGDIFQRTEMLLGKEAVAALAGCRVAVFGVGGVGGYAVEVLARSGVGAIDLYDNDVVAPSNINRQIIATTSTIGRHKVDVAAERVRDINPACKVQGFKMFYVVANADEVDLSQYDICSMGAANKLDATAFRVADISDTDVDPLARIMRKKLRKEGIEHFKCVFSKEQPREPLEPCDDDKQGKRPIPASNAWVPAAAGLVLGGEVVLDLIKTTYSHES